MTAHVDYHLPGMDCFDTRQLFSFAQGALGAEATTALLGQGQILELLGRHEERLPFGTEDENLASARFALARALASEPRDLEKARQLASAALEDYRQLPRTHAPTLERIERWLAEHGGPSRGPLTSER